jgi:hypothetical protein
LTKPVRRYQVELTDVVGLYVDPPAHAVVLSIMKKSQIEALDAPSSGLPIKPLRDVAAANERMRDAYSC